MTYKEELLEKIRNASCWPKFRDPLHLSILSNMADKAFSKNSFEGYIAAVTIYHQITADMVEILIEDIRFLTQYPFEIVFKKRKNQMFGALLDELEHGIDFKQKKAFLSQCSKLNQVRITMVHKLTQQVGGLGLANRQARTAKDIFDRIFTLFDETHDYFRSCLHDLQNDFLDKDRIRDAIYTEPNKGKRSRQTKTDGKSLSEEKL
jgi:hypothetical protein